MLFCGHRGCGKSTELRRLSHKLDTAKTFYVIFLDAVRQLDVQNLQYADILLTLAHSVLDRLQRDEIPIDQVFLTRLENWFKERIESHEATKSFSAEIKAGLQAETGVPLLAKLFASITNALKINSTYKEELRQILQNSFTDFAEAFNQLLVEAEAKVQEQGRGQKLLLVIDGTDRLSEEDSRRFFVTDVHQLQLINGLFIYCAPIYLIYEHNDVNQSFNHVFNLPMIKLSEKGSDEPIEAGYNAMRQMILRRADASLFDGDETLTYFMRYSGGHPRDLLRLLNEAFADAEGELFDAASARQAVKRLAEAYRRLLTSEDYQLLHAIDLAPAGHVDASDGARRLLLNTMLLEYNEYRWQSHPAIRTLPGYLEVAQGHAES